MMADRQVRQEEAEKIKQQEDESGGVPAVGGKLHDAE
jgi:hypothetical protein